MREIKFEPIGRVYLSPMQAKDLHIKKLQYWVLVLGISNAIYTALAIMLLCGAIK